MRATSKKRLDDLVKLDPVDRVVMVWDGCIPDDDGQMVTLEEYSRRHPERVLKTIKLVWDDELMGVD